jgi:hypothetical protein
MERHTRVTKARPGAGKLKKKERRVLARRRNNSGERGAFLTY